LTVHVEFLPAYNILQNANIISLYRREHKSQIPYHVSTFHSTAPHTTEWEVFTKMLEQLLKHIFHYQDVTISCHIFNLQSL